MMRFGLAMLATMALVAASGEPDDVDALMARASAQAAAFGTDLTGYVAREDYLQTVRRWPGSPPTQPAVGAALASRHLHALLLLVHETDSSWQLHRDVVSVDGEPVTDRADRLAALFADPHADARRRLRAITDDSARHNLGHVTRNINVPTFPLIVLHPTHRQRFRFQDRGAVIEQGVAARRLAYTERDRPRIIRGQYGRDVRLHGELIVDAATGELLRAQIEPRSPGLTSRLEVWYAPVAGVPRRVPIRMWEWYHVTREAPESYVEGTATYTDFRRYTTSVSEPRVP